MRAFGWLRALWAQSEETTCRAKHRYRATLELDGKIAIGALHYFFDGRLRERFFQGSFDHRRQISGCYRRTFQAFGHCGAVRARVVRANRAFGTKAYKFTCCIKHRYRATLKLDGEIAIGAFYHLFNFRFWIGFSQSGFYRRRQIGYCCGSTFQAFSHGGAVGTWVVRAFVTMRTAQTEKFTVGSKYHDRAIFQRYGKGTIGAFYGFGDGRFREALGNRILHGFGQRTHGDAVTFQAVLTMAKGITAAATFLYCQIGGGKLVG